jgi:hypothetical protein
VRKPAVETLCTRGSSPPRLRRHVDLERLLAEPVGWMDEGQKPPSGTMVGREPEEPAWTLEFDLLRALRALSPKERLRIAADLAAPAERHRNLTRAQRGDSEAVGDAAATDAGPTWAH